MHNTHTHTEISGNEKGNGRLTLVVSPLIALMNDQITYLNRYLFIYTYPCTYTYTSYTYTYIHTYIHVYVWRKNYQNGTYLFCGGNQNGTYILWSGGNQNRLIICWRKSKWTYIYSLSLSLSLSLSHNFIFKPNYISLCYIFQPNYKYFYVLFFNQLH